MREMNNDTFWIYEASGAMYPSIYLHHGETSEDQKKESTGRIQEAKRLNSMLKEPIPTLTYCNYE